LEWETSAEPKSEIKREPVEIYLEITPWLSFCRLFLAVDRPESFMVALPLWCCGGVSKAILQWLAANKYWSEENGCKGELLPGRSALRTWRFVRDSARPKKIS